MKISFLSLVLFSFLASIPAWTQEKSPASPPPGGSRTSLPETLLARLEAYPNVKYANYGDQELALDLYRPKAFAGRKLPAIVCIHGGGWWRGTRKNHSNVAQALADRGFVTATISYRLSGQAPFPAQIHDCKAAVRFLRANAERFGIDGDQIGAIGLSAGGHLTALLASSGGVDELEGDGGNAEQSSRIQAAVPMGAQTNFRSHFGNIRRTPPPQAGEKPNIWVQFLDGTPEEVPERYLLASPLTHLDAGDPPMHFIAGEIDNDSTHAVLFRKKMAEFEIPEALTVISKAPHAFPGRQEFFDQMVEASADWFKEHLK